MSVEHLYVHIPFCARRCVYCDFSIAVRTKAPVAEYANALEKELSLRHDSARLSLETLYLGGGTPSKLGGDGISRVLEIFTRWGNLRPGAEVTLEANPEDVTPESAAAWRSAGVTRVSLGVQSFDDAVLRWMHRTHDAATARRSIQVLREAEVRNLSIDLIFATPSEVERSWSRDLDAALELELPHLSVYGLTVEPRTPLGKWVARRTSHEAPEEQFEREFLEAHERLVGSGFEHYEVSNYSQPGQHSRHNWAYWERRPYIGLGPSAHEFDGQRRRWNVDPYAGWLARVDAGADPGDGSELLTPEQAAAERTYLNLRTTKGERITEADRPSTERWVRAGWALQEPSVLRLTAAGWLRLDALANDLTVFRSRY